MKRSLTWAEFKGVRVPVQVAALTQKQVSLDPKINAVKDLIYQTVDDAELSVRFIFIGWDEDEFALLDVAKWIIRDPGAVGVEDIDPVAWSIQFGDNFHGLPEWANRFELSEDSRIMWLCIECTDSAS